MTHTPLRHLAGSTAAAMLLLLAGCADGAATDPGDERTASSTSSSPTPTAESTPTVASAADSRTDPPQARRISARLAGLGATRIAVPRGWTVDWLGIGYLHMGPGHHRYSGGSFAVVSAAMASAGLEDLSGSALSWLRQQPGITLRRLPPVELDDRRHPAFEIQGSGQVCGSPAGSPEAAHHSCVNLRGSVQAYVDLGDEAGRSLVVTVGARPLGPHPDRAIVAERRQRLQELVDLVTLP